VTKNPVPPEAAEEFAGHVENWREALCLMDWRVNVSPVRAGKVMAQVHKADLEQRMATIRLGKDFGTTPVNEKSLNETALHEMLHVFLHELIETARVPEQDLDVIRSAEHRVINVLERLLSK
jgi:hypothetical protein